MADKLTHKQRRFVEEYMIDGNATQAAIRAGYSQKTAHVIGPENLGKLSIKAALGDKAKKVMQKAEVTVQWVIEKTQEIIDYGMSEQPILNKEGEVVGTRRANIQAALKGLELMGRHLAMFTDKTEITHNVADAVEQLQLARERLARAQEQNLIQGAVIASKAQENRNGRSLQ